MKIALSADTYRRQIFFNYERRIRLRSRPEKVQRKTPWHWKIPVKFSFQAVCIARGHDTMLPIVLLLKGRSACSFLDQFGTVKILSIVKDKI